MTGNKKLFLSAVSNGQCHSSWPTSTCIERGLFHAMKPYPWESPRKDLAEARRLIEKHGYWRRKGELEDAEAAASNY